MSLKDETSHRNLAGGRTRPARSGQPPVASLAWQEVILVVKRRQRVQKLCDRATKCRHRSLWRLEVRGQHRCAVLTWHKRSGRGLRAGQMYEWFLRNLGGLSSSMNVVVPQSEGDRSEREVRQSS